MAEQLSVDYDDLINVQQLRTDELESTDLDLSGTAGSPGDQAHWDRAVAAIKEATDRIESYLGRRLIVRNYKLEIPPDKWKRDNDFDRYRVWSPEHPVVEIGDSGSDVTFKEPDHDQTILLLDYDADNGPDDEKTIDPVYSGYRRPDQVVGSVQSAGATETDLRNISDPDLSGLTKQPRILPWDIRKVATDLAMNMMHEAIEGNIGGGEITRQIRGEQITIRQPAETLVRQKLESIRRYKREFSHGG